MREKKEPKLIQDDQFSLPSEVNEDPWGEIAEHQDKMHKLDMERKKQEKENTKNLVRDTLANQLKEQEKEKKKFQEYNKRMDIELLKKAKAELEIEKQ